MYSYKYIYGQQYSKKKQNQHYFLMYPHPTIVGILIIIGKTGGLMILLLILHLIAGYLIGSIVQSNCEFKFSRFSKKE